MTTPKTASATMIARLPAPPDMTGASLATTTDAQLATVKGCSDYPNQPGIQACANTLETDNAVLHTALAAWEKAKAALPVLEAACKRQMGIVRRDRHSLSGAITTACNGSTAAIASYGAVTPDAHVALIATAAAPTGLALMATQVPGTIRAKCAVVKGAGSYQWALLTDPNASPTAALPFTSTGSRVSLPGQTIGHVVYLRVSVLRRRGGPSAWSDALQITVR